MQHLMAPLKIKHVVSFSSQDPKSSVENLLCGESGRPWLCSPQDHSGVLAVELQLERATAIGYIDIGNCGSALIQVDVGRSSWCQDQPYVTLLPTATLMSPTESRQGSGRTGVRMFKRADFLSQSVDELWDRVRVTCSQPFNKRLQFGLSFLRIQSPDESEAVESPDVTECQMSPEQPNSKNIGLQVREWLSSPAVQRTVFVQKTGASSPGAAETSQGAGGRLREEGCLSRTARMVLTAARSRRRSLPLPPPGTSASSLALTGPQHREQHRQGDTSENLSVVPPAASTEKPTPRRKGRRPAQSVGPGLCKKLRPAEHVESPLNSTMRDSPTISLSEDCETGVPERRCPICEETFAPDLLPIHASSCQDEGQPFPLGVERSFTPPPSPGFPAVSALIPGQDMVPCPLCAFRYPRSEIQQHASSCGDPGDNNWIWVD